MCFGNIKLGVENESGSQTTLEFLSAIKMAKCWLPKINYYVN